MSRVLPVIAFVGVVVTSPVLSTSPSVLIHDEPGLGQSAGQVRRALDAMIAAVPPIEASR